MAAELPSIALVTISRSSCRGAKEENNLIDGRNESASAVALTHKFRENVCFFTMSCVRFAGMVNEQNGRMVLTMSLAHCTALVPPPLGRGLPVMSNLGSTSANGFNEPEGGGRGCSSQTFEKLNGDKFTMQSPFLKYLELCLPEQIITEGEHFLYFALAWSHTPSSASSILTDTT
jgi:hypothetical protein